MRRNWSKAIPEGNSPVPQQEEFGSGQPTLAGVYRVMKERLDQSDRYWDSMKSHFSHLEKKLDEIVKEMREADERLAGLEQDARQPCLAMAADVQANTKTRERTEGAATAVQVMHADSCFANRVDPDPTCSSTSGYPLFKGQCLGRQRRCGAQVVPLTLEDALTNSRRWLTTHRHGLYSDEDHFPPAAFLILPDRRDNFEDFDSIRPVFQQVRVDK